MPMRNTTAPMTQNTAVQLLCSPKSKPIKPPNTTKMASSGIMALMPSTAPRLVESVESVTQALKAASLAEEPKKVITQSKAMTKDTPTDAAEAAAGNRVLITSVRMRAKLRMDTPQQI